MCWASPSSLIHNMAVDFLRIAVTNDWRLLLVSTIEPSACNEGGWRNDYTSILSTTIFHRPRYNTKWMKAKDKTQVKTQIKTEHKTEV